MPRCDLKCGVCGNEAARPLLTVTSTLGDAFSFPCVQCCNGHDPVEMAVTVRPSVTRAAFVQNLVDAHSGSIQQACREAGL